MASDVADFETGFEASGSVRPQRMDIVPEGGRRRWSPELKARIIAESMAPDANVSEVARRHGIIPQQLYRWRNEAKERMEAGDRTAFVPAMVEKQSSVSATPAGPARCGEIRIDVRGMVVRVPDGVTADHIERVLLAVQVAT